MNDANYLKQVTNYRLDNDMEFLYARMFAAAKKGKSSFKIEVGELEGKHVIRLRELGYNVKLTVESALISWD